jgi:putative polyketide hydroxylase
MSISNQSESNDATHREVRPPPQSFGANVKEVVFGDFDHQDIPLEKEVWPVVIIGSSMVGMMTGLLLGYHGYSIDIQYFSACSNA